MKLLQSPFSSQSGAKNQNAKNGKPLDHWKELEKNKRVISMTSDVEIQQEIWEAVDPNFWRDHLSRKEYNVLREKGTEAPKSSVYGRFYPEEGYYACRACGNPLYAANSKFDSGSGWPSFGTSIGGNVVTRPHYEWGLRREEVCCRRCRSHLGHVFLEKNAKKFDRHDDGYTERQCINGVCLQYIKEPLPEGSNSKTKLLST